MTKKEIVNELLKDYTEAANRVEEYKKCISNEDGGYYWNEKCKQEEPEWEVKTSMIHNLGYYEGIMNSTSRMANIFGYEFVRLRNKKIKARRKTVETTN